MLYNSANLYHVIALRGDAAVRVYKQAEPTPSQQNGGKVTEAKK